MRMLVLAACCAAAIAATTNRLHLSWDNAPDFDSNVDFHIYSKTNLSEPWVHLTNVTWMDYTNWTKVEVPAAANYQQFYVVTASNMTGESDFSDSVWTRRLQPGTRLKIGSY